MTILFRTDASHVIGIGHVMRCLALASALRDRGALCRFICREHAGHLIGLIREQGFETLALPIQNDGHQSETRLDEPSSPHGAWLGADWKTDADATKTAIGDTGVDWLVVDHYALDARWEKALRPCCRKILVIDDLADRQHDCDLLLDQNLVANMANRYDGKMSDGCGSMLGPEYALLQPQYAKLHSSTPPREGPVKRIMVYFGGADNLNLTGLAITSFLSLELEDIVLDVVINPGGPNSEIVREMVQGQPNISLHTSLPSLAPLMAKADLAIGGGGATSWERCCLGLPSLVITLAENQKPVASELGRQGLVHWVGDQGGVTADKLAHALREVIDSGLNSSWSEVCQQQVDGKGVDRVSGILLLGAETPLRARLARMGDEALILKWANDPIVRRNAFVTDVIDAESHREWFHKRVGNLDRCQLYVVETEDGLPVGQVRFEESSGAWEIHYGLDARFRGRGVGVVLLQTAIDALENRSGRLKNLLFGRVKPKNWPSRKIFQRLGFVEESAGNEFVYRLSQRV